jgi:acetylornithine deacetylase/succinyl-diaminopimelate desuccinylase-like protein
MTIDPVKNQAFVDALWGDSITPTLTEYIAIPNKSPMFDPEWQAHGYMEQAVTLVSGWCSRHLPAGAELEVLRLEGRTPLIFIDVPSTRGGDDTVLLYGHLDKQPEMVGWSEGLGPWQPVLRGDRLYGRGGADDGYAAFATLAALLSIQDQKAPRPRCVVIIEACEESGSYDLPYYIDHLADRIGTPSLVVCLDSGCGNYDQLWCTTSLRGMITGDLRVELLREGVHSGDASGIVASSFRVARHLLSRLEDPETGHIRLPELHAEIPAERIEQARSVAERLGTEVYDKFPLHDGVSPIDGDLAELVLNRTWRPALAVTGAEGLPPIGDAGNVMRPLTALKLSLRLPPTCDSDAAVGAVRRALEADPPYGARVALRGLESNRGWNAPALAPDLGEALQAASQAYFGAPAMFMGEGGSIPFMAMLGEKFPAAQFVITGVLGPHSNAHGPNEFLHLPTARRLSACVAQVIAGL